MTRPRKPRLSPSDAPDQATARSAARRARAAYLIPSITLDAEHAAALRRITRGRAIAVVVRELILEAARNLNVRPGSARWNRGKNWQPGPGHSGARP